MLSTRRLTVLGLESSWAVFDEAGWPLPGAVVFSAGEPEDEYTGLDEAEAVAGE